MTQETTEIKQQCPEFPYFGAWYPDARCIDGTLWDLDKFEDGQLYGGGEDPCPFCNKEAFIERHLDELNGVTLELIDKWIDHWQQRYGTPKKAIDQDTLKS